MVLKICILRKHLGKNISNNVYKPNCNSAVRCCDWTQIIPSHVCVSCRVLRAIYMVNAHGLAFAYRDGPHSVNGNAIIISTVSSVIKLAGRNFLYVISE